MINALRAELLKMRTMPGVWVTFGLAFPLTVLGILVVFAVRPAASRATPSTSSRRCSQRRELLGAGYFGIEVLAPIIGVLCITSEYRHKTITTSLVLVPDPQPGPRWPRSSPPRCGRSSSRSCRWSPWPPSALPWNAALGGVTRR